MSFKSALSRNPCICKMASLNGTWKSHEDHQLFASCLCASSSSHELRVVHEICVEAQAADLAFLSPLEGILTGAAPAGIYPGSPDFCSTDLLHINVG